MPIHLGAETSAREMFWCKELSAPERISVKTNQQQKSLVVKPCAAKPSPRRTVCSDLHSIEKVKPEKPQHLF